MIRVVLFVVCLSALPVCAADWQAKKSPLMTKWAADVTPETVHPEYPRPQLVRDQWLNLNGLWDYAIQAKAEGQPSRWESEKILVPFPVESALSGVMKFVGPENKLWYRKTFSVPTNAGKVDPAWAGKNILLHFGAVDWETTVWINGKEIGSHKGGYDPFSFDISKFLEAGRANELIVSVWDPSDGGFQGRGKQVQKPGGIFYTPTTGIWQTVWLEPVPATFIRSVTITPDLDQRQLIVEADVVNPRPGYRVGVIANSPSSSKSGAITATIWTPEMSRPIIVPLGRKDAEIASHVWSPDHPHLIDVHVALVADPNADVSQIDATSFLTQNDDAAKKKASVPMLDAVKSYSALRKISLGKDAKGTTRIMFNNEPLFQVGPLDQGFWPDGLYTAPTDAALRFDIEQTKAYGFNMIRKHVKVEPARWYHHCDKLGMLVWQDMPSGDRSAEWDPFGKFDNKEFTRSVESAADYRREWKSIIDARRNCPCIVMWVPFNEGWGQSDTVAVTNWTRSYDPTRLVNCASGGNDFPVGDVIDVHRYPGPFAPIPTADRAAVLGEFGGLGLPIENHTWQGKENWGYRSFTDQKSLRDAYVDLFEQLHPLIANPGLSAAVYTQTTDVETEVNGLMTYDRKVMKVPVETAAKIHAALHRPARQLRTLVASSRTEPQTWSYTHEKPGEGWEKPPFNADAWKSGPGGFGEKSTPGSVVRTEWKTNDIWLRRTFDLKDVPTGEIRALMHHDEDTEVYINGVLAISAQSWTTEYRPFRLTDEGATAFKSGKNTIAVHCKQTIGGQYIDIGINELVEAGR